MKSDDLSFRPVPFWSWNDKLDPEQLRFQIQQMARQHLGGFFMHARGGLRTQYMSPEWFNCVEACIDEAIKTGTDAWLYDENGWPSGFGNGIVNGKGEAYQQKYLRHATCPKDIPQNRILAVINGETYYYDVNPYYVDNLDGAVVDEFIKNVHEVYKAKLAPDKWAKIKGVFTDEPQISRNGIPWSAIIPEEYKKEYKRDILQELPGLFFENVDGYRGVRFRFWTLVTRLFRDNFMKKIHDWCEANGKLLTGHHVLEETLLHQLTCNGAIMPQYEFYHIPGVDWLGRGTPSSQALVQLASVAAQTGQSRLMVETFACCGWNVSFQDLRWMAQIQLVHGINFFCQHLEGYSLRGIRKRDYPASLFIHQPWWNEYHAFNDWVAAVGKTLLDGETPCNILILHPQSTAWTEFNNADNGNLQRFEKGLIDLTEKLEAHQILFHYGDELVMKERGNVQDGILHVGNHAYTTVIIPQMNTFSSPVFKLLKDFAQAGGSIYAVQGMEYQLEQLTPTLDGEDSAELRAFMKTAVHWFVKDEELISELTSHGYPLCTLTGAGKSIIATKRIRPNDALYYFINSNPSEKALVKFDFSEDIISVEDSTGKSIDMPVCSGKTFLYEFERGGAIFVHTKLPNAKQLEPTSEISPNMYSLELLNDNALMLDFCKCFADGKLLSDRIPTISLMRELLNFERSVNTRLEFAFEVSEELASKQTPLRLMLETPEIFTIAFNGKIIPNTPDGHYWDTAFKTIPLPPPLPGKNTITLDCKFEQSPEVYPILKKARYCETEGNKITFDTELESIAILGKFAVKNTGNRSLLSRTAERQSGPFVLVPLPQLSTGENLQNDGLPFFAGSVKLARTFDGNDITDITCANLYGNALNLTINGVDLGTLPWRPYSWKIPSGLLKEKDNTVQWTITGNLRNLLGPHHMQAGESYAVGPSSFFKDNHYFWDFPMPVWNDDYCLVRFGMDF